MEFKDRIKNLREAHKLSATQLATLFGRSEGAVRMWETGRSKPDADTLVIISKHFDCTVDYILGISDYKNAVEYEDIKDNSNELNEVICSLEVSLRNKLLKSLIEGIQAINREPFTYENVEILIDVINHNTAVYTAIDNFNKNPSDKRFMEFILALPECININNEIIKHYTDLFLAEKC